MSTLTLTLHSPAEMALSLADRVRALRLTQDWTRATLARRAGVSASSLKRFENTGKASLELVLKVAHALGRLEEFDKPLRRAAARSVEELEQQTARPARRRGRR